MKFCLRRLLAILFDGRKDGLHFLITGLAPEQRAVAARCKLLPTDLSGHAILDCLKHRLVPRTEGCDGVPDGRIRVTPRCAPAIGWVENAIFMELITRK